jgi:4-diphosphocytidyl-2-C-methyl-D-erythritol kinase
LKEIYIKAPAKINLVLHIKGLRKDGYHELEMIMQSISLADRIKLKKNSGGIIIKNSDYDLPSGQNNLAYQSAELFFEKNNIDQGVEIYIQKNIPIASGMAGGSSDAAAVMRGLYDLYNIEPDFEQMREYLAEIGSDVPYCLEGGTVYASGRGEKIEFLPFIGEKYLVIVTPKICVSTPEVFSIYDEMKDSSHNKLNKYNIKKIINNIKSEQQIDWNLDFKNDLSAPARTLCSEIKEIEDIIKNTGPQLYLMSGSGPTVFAVYESRKESEKVAINWPRKNDFVITAKTIDRY